MTTTPSRVDHTPSGKPVTHGGSGSDYSHYGCRCDECRAASSNRVIRRRQERASNPVPPHIGHGKTSTYNNYGCRCDLCAAAKAEENSAAYQARKEASA